MAVDVAKFEIFVRQYGDFLKAFEAEIKASELTESEHDQLEDQLQELPHPSQVVNPFHPSASD